MTHGWALLKGPEGARRSMAALAAGLALAATVAGSPRRASAQNYFGQNQVQYAQFDWRVLETEHFLIYYYPQEREATMDAARMAERDYARLSRVLDHQFREKKPLVLFASRTDFGQNNVTGDLGEGTGGVTEALRHRMLLNFTGDYRSFEHVLTHEMVHAFQYDIFARGKAGAGLQTLAQVNPPLWFAEGMAEYLSLGPSTPLTTTWMRDAALNGKIPTMQQLTDHPDRYFPYRYGHSFWTYVGRKFGDEAIGQIMNAVPSVGIERAFKRELGVSLEDLGEEWKEDLQTRLLPPIGTMDRPRRFAQSLLTPRKSGGEIFLAPSLSQDGKYIAFLSNGSFTRGQVFIDLWLGDGESGKRIKRLVKSTTDPNFEELRLLYSQSAFSPDDRFLAFTAQAGGKDVLYILDVASRNVIRKFDLPLDGVTGPSWSPDGKRLVFSGSSGGITDLFMVNADGTDFRRLTNDRFGDVQPQWSPDGKLIAFASDRGPDASFELLKFPKWRINVLDLEKGTITVLPGQAGLNINPQWAPDGRSIAYVSDRTGVANVFLYDLDRQEQYQLTNVAGAVSALTEYSPAITWARKADRLAFTYYENGDYTIWTINHPRSLRGAPYRDKPPVVVAQDEHNRASTDPAVDGGADGRQNGVDFATRTIPDTGAGRAATDTGAARSPSNGSGSASRSSQRATVSIAALLDSFDLALPDTTKFRDYAYRVRFQPDYVSRPSIGYTPDNYGRNVYGGTTVVLSDMLGNNRLALSGGINGRISESQLYAGYTNLGRRWQYSTGFSQAPYYFLSNDVLSAPDSMGVQTETQEITTYVARQIFGVTAYPLNRFTRFEIGGGFNNIDRSRWFIHRSVFSDRSAQPFQMDTTHRDPTLNYVDAQLAYVSDNTLFGYSGPLEGRRYRFQVSPVVGSFNWVEYLADYRRYDAIIFDYLTLATRLYANMSIGPNEREFPKYIARPDFVRGYDRNNSFYLTCPVLGANTSNCSAVQLLGSRVAVANAELRFPLVRQIDLGIVPVSLPPLDGVLFYDEGLAWSRGQTVYGSRPDDFDVNKQRYPLRSYGFGLRVNLFNYAMLRWDYAVPLDQPGHKGFWTWSLWPSF